MTQIKKAIFPVAGLGTRFLPATKATPKEMLPIVDKPLIQYAVEEAIAAGVTELIFVTSHSKRAIEDHFDSNRDLEAILESKDKQTLLTIVRNVLPEGVTCVYVRQPKPRGLGDAILCARHVIGDEPFAVLLADDLISVTERGGCLQQMVEKENSHSIVAVQQIESANLDKYGVVAVQDCFLDPLEKMLPGKSSNKLTCLYPMTSIIEKPTLDKAPSNLGVIGRYIFTPRIFHYLTQTNPDQNGEIQLTHAIAQLLKEEPVYAFEFAGRRYDCGSKLGYLEATIEYALKHSDVGEEFKRYLSAFCYNHLV